MRSLLFVPADSEKKLSKAAASGADGLILDLEDSVAATAKETARGMAAEWLRSRSTGPLAYVRVNDLRTGLTDADLDAVVRARPDGIMLPKCAGLADVEHLSAKLRVREADAGLADGGIRILPIITETAAAVLAAHSYGAGQSRLSAVTWGAEDLAADIGAQTNRDETGRYTDVFRLARSVTILAAASAGIAAIDTVFPDFRNEAGFLADCKSGERDGFTGRMAIHPAQVSVINAVYTPSAEAMAVAQSIVDAFAEAGNPGVVSIDGRMYDRPHLRHAERVLARGRHLA